MRRALLLVLGAVCGLALLPGRAFAYGWPIMPFDRQHPVRAFFNDPRREFNVESFHFGIDISAPNGTAVYAVEPGEVHLRPDAVTVVSTGHTLGYWHVIPIVSQGEHVEAHQQLGVVMPPWAHVHFAENIGGVYVNPLRRGALAPFVDTTSPTIAALVVSSRERALSFAKLTGVVDVVANAYDTPPPPVPPQPWTNARVTPAALRWRLLQGQRVIRPWRTSIDFGNRLMPPDRYEKVYARGTRQNRPNRPGRYRFYLCRRWDTRNLVDGTYRIEVMALDTQGNSAESAVDVTIANAPAHKRYMTYLRSE